MSEQTGQRLAAALRAQASSLPGVPSPVPDGRNGQPPPAIRGWVLLLTAVLLGTAAGVLAALVSTL